MTTRSLTSLARTPGAPAVQTHAYPTDLTLDLQRALASLADVETRYEVERKVVERWPGPPPIRKRLLAELESRRIGEREPLVQRLAELQQRITCAMMFEHLKLH